MNNSEIAHHLSTISRLMDIHNLNSFKAKSLSIAAYKIDKMEDQLQDLKRQNISSIQGIGESIGKIIIELLETNQILFLNELVEKTPEGIMEMMNIKGLGPKKISIIWKEMDIESIGELIYACNENRLLLYKGFGKKTQENVIESIEFYQSQKGNYLYAQLEVLVDELSIYLKKLFNTEHIYLTGDFRRQSETIDLLEFIVCESSIHVSKQIISNQDFSIIESNPSSLLLKYDKRIAVKIYTIKTEDLGITLLKTTGSETFVKLFEKELFQSNIVQAENEKIIFDLLKMQYIEPSLRESEEIIQISKNNLIPTLIQQYDIKGLIHCHSVWSDGVNTIEELARSAINLGLEYLVISDHSRAAFYANGLTEEKIYAQHEQINNLNKKYPSFKIFKSIECDILSDGKLDYDNSILSSFDLVISSVHSNLKMNENKAMSRLIKAIENPHTVILGHMTGRLLLSRMGYPVDFKKIIDACAANKVVIELNAHPKRLDIRWQWLSYALNKNVLISINPDAHSTIEFVNLKYGVLSAQKGMLTKHENLSSFSLKHFEHYLSNLCKK